MQSRKRSHSMQSRENGRHENPCDNQLILLIGFWYWHLVKHWFRIFRYGPNKENHVGFWSIPTLVYFSKDDFSGRSSKAIYRKLHWPLGLLSKGAFSCRKQRRRRWPLELGHPVAQGTANIWNSLQGLLSAGQKCFWRGAYCVCHRGM